MRFRLTLVLSLALLVMPSNRPAGAQDMPALVADSIFINADQTLIAEGAVEVLYKGQRLKATRITYDPATDRLVIEGPITIDDGQGTVMFAEAADLSADLRDGILRSARLFLQDQLQIAAT